MHFHEVYEVYNQSRGLVLAQAGMAATFGLRARGLLGRPPLKSGEGLILSPCNSIHTLGMTYHLDVLFVNAAGCAVRLLEVMPPNRLGPLVRGARYAVELPAGTLAASGTCPGDLIHCLLLKIAASPGPSRRREGGP